MPSANASASGPSRDVPPRIHQLLHAPTDDEYLDQLINVINDAQSTGHQYDLVEQLRHVSQEREQEIERLCNSNHQDFVASVNQLLKVRKGTVTLTEEILELNESIQNSTQRVVEHKKALVDSRDVRQNIDEATQALRLCLEVLGLANKVSELLRTKRHYAALRTLDELQNVHLKEVVQFDVADLVQQSVPSMKGKVKEAVWSDLTTWLYRVRENSQLLGQVAFDQTELRRRRQKEREEHLRAFKLNSAIELVLDEREEFDVLNNENITIDFTPFFECLHIHEAMGEREEFKTRYTDTRRQQKELLVPSSITIHDDDTSPINQLLEGIAGFAIVERATVMKAGGFRTAADVDELWRSLSKKAIKAIHPAIESVKNFETLLKVKNVVAGFIQTMDSWGYAIDVWDKFLLDLFYQYLGLLKREFTLKFRQHVDGDDYGDMPVQSRANYEEICNDAWVFNQLENQPNQSTTAFPRTFPFSKMYYLCCKDIREFLNKYHYFSDGYFTHQSVIDNELKKSIDELLQTQVCDSLTAVLLSRRSTLGQIARILINFSYFTSACQNLEYILSADRPELSVTLAATSRFLSEQKTAEKRVFEVVNEKIDDLVGNAQYDFTKSGRGGTSGVSEYMREATNFFDHIVNTALAILPKEISGLLYFDAVGHLAKCIIGLMMDNDVTAITKDAVEDVWVDVEHLCSVAGKIKEEHQWDLGPFLEELLQTVELMRSGNGDEFYEVAKGNKKYARVNRENGPVLLEKIYQGEQMAIRKQQAMPEEKKSAGVAALARTGLAGLAKYSGRS
ncbi:exocyst complex subunit Sec15-like protein [Ascodesmis nigricans]|uniref:Exocyst complex component SEC15 n=1 Tax=Ascodesmis nigricans TaxID=341454 RepID=A0A4S2N0Q8_9PEZI|nr:exocyst complex subunit Sec15-like protein [Ascodesmis nigricans]